MIKIIMKRQGFFHLAKFQNCFFILFFGKTSSLEAVSRRCSIKKVFLKKFRKIHRKNLCQSLFLIKLQTEICNFTKKETLAQVFSCEFCEISKSTFSYRTLPVATSTSSLPKQFIMLFVHVGKGSNQHKRKNSQEQPFTDVLENSCS